MPDVRQWKRLVEEIGRPAIAQQQNAGNRIRHQHGGWQLLDHRLQAGLCTGNGLLRNFSGGDVDEGNDDTRHPAILGSVGERAPQIIAVAVTAHFGFEGCEVCQNPPGIQEQVVVRELLREVLQRTADVSGNELQQVADRGGEAPHAQLRIQEYNCDVRAAEQVVKIVRQRFELEHFRL